MGLNDNHRFGSTLKTYRESVALTQEQLALAIGLEDGSSISGYEHGKNLPPQRRLDEIIRVLIEHGAPKECAEKLYEYSGYASGSEYTSPIIAEIARAQNDLAQELFSKTLFEKNLQLIVDHWKKYINALRALRRRRWSDARIAFEMLLQNIDDELPFRKPFHARILQRLGDVCRRLGEPLQAIEYYNESIQLTEQGRETEWSVLAALLLDRGDGYRWLNQWEKAKEDYGRSSHIFKQIEINTGNSQEYSIALVDRRLVGLSLFQGVVTDETLKNINTSIDTFHEMGVLEEENKGKQHKAWSQAVRGYWDEALEIHKEVVQALTKPRTNPVTLAKGQRMLADVYRMSGLLDKAETTYKNALDNLKDHPNEQGYQEDLLVVGMIQLGLGGIYRAYPAKWSEAERYLNDSLVSHRKSGSRLYEARTHQELGRLALERNDFEQAAREFNSAKETFSTIHNHYYITAIHIDLSELEYRRGNYPEARAHAEKAISYAEEYGLRAHLVRAELKLAEINRSEPDEHQPLALYLSALRAARNLNPYLVHEVLCRIVGDSHILANESSVRTENLRLCKVVSVEHEELLENNVSSEHDRQEWLREITQLEESLKKPNNTSPFVRGRALLIGIDTYSHLRHLNKSATDARDLGDFLVQHGYPNTTTLENAGATKGAINDSLDSLARQASAQDTVILFFSGHGAQYTGGFEPGEYFCPVEAHRQNPRNSAISNEELTKALKAIPARQLVVFLDACHSGGVGEPKDAGFGEKSGFSDATYEELASGEGRVVIASCRPNEVSWELPGMRNSLFTHYLLQGLRGGAKDDDGIVRVFNLFDYIAEHVAGHDKGQNPLIKASATSNFQLF